METNEIKEHIVRIIENATLLVKAAYTDDTNKTRLCFPKYSATGDPRVSEQEFRFALVEAFNEYVKDKDKGLDWRYAVEVPTEDRYLFINKNNIIKSADEGRSAMFDLVIYNGSKERICLIEFKAGNPDGFCYDKDYIKLLNEKEGNENVVRCFLQLLKSHDNGTVASIQEKTKCAMGEINTANIQIISQTYSLKDDHINLIFSE